MITDLGEYFARGAAAATVSRRPSARPGNGWRLERLRAIRLDVGLTETAAGHRYACGPHITVLGAFRGDFRMNFVHAALLKDPEGVLEPQGPNPRIPACSASPTRRSPR